MTQSYDPFLWLRDIRPDKAEVRLAYFKELARTLSADRVMRFALGDGPDDEARDALLALVRAQVRFARAQLNLLSPPSDPQSPATS